MKPYLTAQQLAFFGDRGYIAFEEFPLDLAALKATIEQAHQKTERDLWRKDPALERLIVRKLGPVALQLTQKKTLYIASDDWVPPAASPPTEAIDLHLSFQGLSCIICLFLDDTSPLFFLKPSVWPSQLSHWPNPPGAYYRIALGGSDARYVVNTKDPLNHQLKRHGFGYGDLLHKNPIIQ